MKDLSPAGYKTVCALFSNARNGTIYGFEKENSNEVCEWVLERASWFGVTVPAGGAVVPCARYYLISRNSFLTFHPLIDTSAPEMSSPLVQLM